MSRRGRRLRLLDLFACAGLVGDGYSQHFDVYAVDLDHRALAHNPHPQHHGDALEVLRRLIAGDKIEFRHRSGRLERLGLSDFAVIHASPPCQGHSATRNLANAQGRGRGRAVDLLPQTLRLLRRTGLPWVVENVERSPLKHHPDVVRLCGAAFGLKVQRHRLFISEGLHLEGTPCGKAAPHVHANAWDRDPRTGKPRPWGVYYAKGDEIPDGGRTVRTTEDGHEVMGVRGRRIPWKYLCEGLPPVYGSFLGAQILPQLTRKDSRAA